MQMSLITQCPACSTLFKVVPDQLRISDGWVRCGQCDEVFDANANIRADVPLTDVVIEPSQQEQVETEYLALETEQDDGEEEAAAEVGSPEDFPIDEEVVEQSPDPFLDKSPKELSDFSAAVTAVSHQDEQPESSERRYMQMFAPQSAEHADPKLSFMRPVSQPSRWNRRGVRGVLAVCSALLMLLAALQVVLHERDRLAVLFPEYRSEIALLCTPLGFEIKPLRQIESVVIDSSAFAKVRNEVYKLNFVLKNTASTTLATPSLELTLTDMQDQTLVRKVFAPGDFGSVPDVMSAGSELTVSLPVSVRAPVAVERVSGYRLLAFYP
jgi:predicted Zn finger-like uncharacterized protein